MTIGSIGELLKESRQAKGYSVREVSEEIHIMSRYIDALERDDYTIFPGETYITGFLTRYGEFLGLNAEELMQQYRGMKLEYSETPLKELTEVTRQSGFSKLQIDIGKLQKIALVVATLMIVGALIWRLASADLFQADEAVGAISCSDRTAEKISATGAIDTVTMIDPDRAIVLETDAGDLKVCLASIDQGRGDRALATLEFVYNGKQYEVQSREGETLPLQTNIASLSELKNPISLTIREIGDVSIKLRIQNETTTVSTMPIRVTLEIIQDSYLEWTADGKTQTAGYLTLGEKRTLEAESRLEVKIGNGAGVRIYRDGQLPKLAGPPAKIVKLVLSKTPNPLDPTRFQIQEELTVAK